MGKRAGIRVRFYSDTNLEHFIEELERDGDTVYLLSSAARVVSFVSNPSPTLLEIAKDLSGDVEEDDG